MNGFADIKKILVPSDFSEISLEALKYAIGLVEGRKITLELFHVIDVIVPSPAYYEPIVIPAYYKEEQLLGVRKKLESMASRFIPEAIDRRIEAVVFPYPARAIVDKARREGHDLIVMGTHGREGLQHFFLGSVAEDVIRQAGCPVLTVGPAAVESPEAQEA